MTLTQAFRQKLRQAQRDYENRARVAARARARAEKVRDWSARIFHDHTVTACLAAGAAFAEAVRLFDEARKEAGDVAHT